MKKINIENELITEKKFYERSKKTMKKIFIVFSILVTFFYSVQPINAIEEYADDEVIDFLDTVLTSTYKYYLIGKNNNGGNMLIVSTHNFHYQPGTTTRIVTNGSNIGYCDNGTGSYEKVSYKTAWEDCGFSTYTYKNHVGDSRNSIAMNTLDRRFNNSDIYTNPAHDKIAFPVAPAVTSAYLRTKATVGAIQEMGATIPVVSGMILQIGLVVLSALLVITLVKRLRRWVTV